jgi:hypothetical protein
VIDDFIDRVIADGRLNANPAVNEAHLRVLPAGFKYLVTELVGVRPANRVAAMHPTRLVGQAQKWHEAAERVVPGRVDVSGPCQ